MKRIRLLAPLLPLVLLLGCSNPAKDVPAAGVEPVSNSASNAPAATEAAGTYFVFGPKTSAIAFIGSKVTRSHNGGFRNFAGELKVVNGQVAATGNKVVIDASSLFADDARLTGHLKGPDFFGVAQYPTATFVSTAIAQKGTNWTLTGDLTLHGVTKSISFPAKIEVNDEGVHVTSVFKINRNDFGIAYPGMANDLIRQDVVLSFNVKSSPGRADFASLEQAAQAGASAPQSAPRPAGGRPPGGGAPGAPRPPG
jgi:polyisoprenoid-binding protein YceI